MSPNTSINIHRITRIETKRNTPRKVHPERNSTWVSFFFYDAEGGFTEVTVFCSNELAEAAVASFPARVELSL